jgi:Fe-S-cluster formation regulator IscX/YfhJ
MHICMDRVFALVVQSITNTKETVDDITVNFTDLRLLMPGLYPF